MVDGSTYIIWSLGKRNDEEGAKEKLFTYASHVIVDSFKVRIGYLFIVACTHSFPYRVSRQLSLRQSKFLDLVFIERGEGDGRRGRPILVYTCRHAFTYAPTTFFDPLYAMPSQYEKRTLLRRFFMYVRIPLYPDTHIVHDMFRGYPLQSMLDWNCIMVSR